MPCLDRAGRAMPGSTNARICPASDGPALFLSLKGRRLSARAIDLAVRHLGQEADVGTSAHTLRHTCLTRLVRAGNDIVWSASSPATPGSRPPAATAGPATRTDRQPWTASTPTTDCRQTAALSGGSCAVATYTPTGGWTLPGVSPSRQRGRDPQQRDRVTDFQVGGGRLHVSAVLTATRSEPNGPYRRLSDACWSRSGQLAAMPPRHVDPVCRSGGTCREEQSWVRADR